MRAIRVVAILLVSRMTPAANLVAPTPPMTWLLVLVIGPMFHWVFSVVMFYLGLKTRPA